MSGLPRLSTLSSHIQLPERPPDLRQVSAKAGLLPHLPIARRQLPQWFRRKICKHPVKSFFWHLVPI